MIELQKFLSKDPAYDHLRTSLINGEGTVAVFGSPENHRAQVISALYLDKTVLYITASELDAVKLHAEVSAYCDALLFLPREMPLVHVQAVSFERRSQRLAVLSRLALGVQSCVVTCAAAVTELLAPKGEFLKLQRCICVGDELSPRDLIASLIEAGYERVPLLESQGQCALRGDIIDVFPPQSTDPYRIEFFGDQVDQIRLFNVQSQRSRQQETACVLPPAYETPQQKDRILACCNTLSNATGFSSQLEAWEQGLPCVSADVLLPLLFEEQTTLFDYLPQGTMLLLNEPQRILDESKTHEALFCESVSAMLQRGEGLGIQAKLCTPSSQLISKIDTKYSAAFYTLFRTCNLLHHSSQVQFSVQPAPLYMGDMDTLFKELRRQKQNKEAVLLYCGDSRDNLYAQLQNADVPCAVADALGRPPIHGEILLLSEKLPRGYCFSELHLTVLTANELFSKQQRIMAPRKKNVLKFSDLSVGDFVVHEAHGIGRFVGVEQLTVQNVTRDYLLFAYRGDDKLYIPTDQLDRIQKYVGGGEDYQPQLSKMGGNDWQGRVSRAKAGAKKLAVDLAELYEKRSRLKGFAFSKDNEWQRKLEERFPYEETPDQLQSIIDIKADMEKNRPMDRLLCGDVGYGKTEVALRAAFKAVQDSKQVAFLVPTTILAQQHYSTLESRFHDFPIKMKTLSRFQSPKERQQIKKQLSTGELDIVVGTHALLAKDVNFFNLGLLIIDEEHRFGVNHKEKIKALRSEVDVLTLTATPIPRTLNLSMTGILDISTIDTPPENRYPVQTFVMEFSDALCQEALSRELARGGQAFVVSNNVLGMESTHKWLSELIPNASIDIANGQMPERQLESAMERFMRHETDILICSTIIESGVDFPNANTLIVLDADKFGLAQLYQLRGRVGRSNRMAYAYFTVRQAKIMTETAHKRLMAIREFTQFGAGFRLAMRDLEIRGAGTLLGAEQHGHIADIGYDYYCKLMKQAVSQAKGEPIEPEIDTTLDVPVDAFVPRDFVPSELLRLNMYRRIAQISDQEAYDDLLDEFFDRYGDLPTPIMNLMQLSLIKALASKAGIELVTVRDGKVTLQYAPTASPDGARLLALLSEHEGAHLTAAESVKIEILKKNAQIGDFVIKLPQFLTRLWHCNFTKVDV
ncbi:MAG: transcription-repair coupling factor [Eubacteriales bacterium]|nr:transcription-repair coupling factor [Eubacteriales bacterium]